MDGRPGHGSVVNISLPKQIAAREAAALGSRVTRMRRDLRAIRTCGIVLVLIAVVAASVAAADLLAHGFLNRRGCRSSCA